MTTVERGVMSDDKLGDEGKRKALTRREDVVRMHLGRPVRQAVYSSLKVLGRKETRGVDSCSGEVGSAFACAEAEKDDSQWPVND